MEGSVKTKKARRRTTPTGAYSGKTKMDKWFEDCVQEDSTLDVVIQPPAPYPYSDKNPDNCKFRVRILEVDRYNVRLEFSDHVSEYDGAVWWVSKDSIRAAALHVDDLEFDDDFDEDQL